MRTTLTLDDDVAIMLKDLQEESQLSFKEVVNKTLRQGFNYSDSSKKPKKEFKQKTYNLGKAFINLDNIAEALAIVEGEDYR